MDAVLDHRLSALFSQIVGEIVVLIGDVSITDPDERFTPPMALESEVQSRTVDAVTAIAERNVAYCSTPLRQRGWRPVERGVDRWPR